MTRTLLFVAEGVALAHVSRPLVLAQVAHERGYRVVFATDPRHRWLLADHAFEYQPLPSIDPSRFLAAIERGAPLFDRRALLAYAEDDLALLRRIRPDLVVGDLRLSLSASARIAKVPYAAIANAYWSPYLSRPRFGMPPLARLRAIPPSLGDRLFSLARPLAFAWHARPVNAARRAHGLPAIRADVRHAYTDADYVLYADVPEMHATSALPSSHRFLGPILWSPRVALPAWWDALGDDRSVIYLTLGSSGDPALLPRIVAELASLPAQVIVAAAGASLPSPIPPNVFVADYLPGNAAASRSALVVCNGGAPTAHQALAAGVPVLGVATNMDQVLNMNAIVAAGVGKLLVGNRTLPGDVREAARRILEDARCRAAAREVREVFARYPAADRFAGFLTELLG